MRGDSGDKLRWLAWAGAVLLGLVILAFVAQRAIDDDGAGGDDVPLSALERSVAQGRVRSVTLYPARDELEATLKNGEELSVGYPEAYSESLIRSLRAERVEYRSESPGSGWWYYLLLLAFYAGFWIWLARRLTRLEARLPAA